MRNQTFEENIINAFGEAGRKWLYSLPNIIEKLAQQWSLTQIHPVKQLNWNYVALALLDNNKPVVLKISCDQQLIRDEYNALTHFAGHGSIRVFAINAEYNSLLLQRAMPGFTLQELVSDVSKRIDIYATIVKALASSKVGYHATHVKTWCDAVDRMTDSRIERFLLDRARYVRSRLLNTMQQVYLCHGDLHLENILQHNTDWLAIDPKGILGEMAFEAAAFDVINPTELHNGASISTIIRDRVTKLASALAIHYDRLLAWFFLRTIISAQWSIEDNHDPSKMMLLAKQIYPLLTDLSYN